METSTLVIVFIMIAVAIVISMFIEDKTYKIYYFLILALGGLTFLSFYLTIVYYIKLRNEPGIPGPRGPKGEQGPSGAKGKCVLTEKCGFTSKDLDEILYDMAAQTFQTTRECIKAPSLSVCDNGPQEVERLKPVSNRLKSLEELALQGNFTKQELQTKIRNTFNDI